MSAPLVFIDTETTGLHPERRAWEIAMIRTDENGHSKGCSFFLGDVDLSRADLRGLHVGGFYDRHPLFNGQHTNHSGAERSWYSANPFGGHADYRILSEAQAARHVEKWTRGAHLVGAVPSFDAETLSGLLRHHHLVPSWHHHLIDVEALALGYLRAQLTFAPAADVIDLPTDVADLPWSSDDLSRAIGVEPPTDERHTAMGDARWAKAIYERVMGGGTR
jgi:hypothetical protein